MGVDFIDTNLFSPPIRSRYHYGFYDSLIVAAALEAGCARLSTEDLQHGQKIEGLLIENPFLA